MKVKAKELRVGNLIQFQAVPYVPDFTELEVFKLSKNRINGKHQSCFKAIPLTEELLLNLGFKNEYQYYDLEAADCWLTVNMKSKNWAISENREDFTTCWKEINYLHELQNLYFGLTKKELTLNTQKHETSKTQKADIGV